MRIRHLGKRLNELKPGPPGVFLVFLLSLTLGACDTFDKLLDVEAPGDVLEENIADPAAAPLLVESAVADFECAFGNYIVSAGLFGSEFTDSQQTAAQWDFDRRSLQLDRGWYASNTCEDRIGTYTPLSTARWSADRALERLDGWTDEEVPGDRTALIATAAAYAGYSYVLLGEGFCSAAVDGGPELTPDELFETAEERFTRAIDAGEQAGEAEIVSMARVGRARARLNLGRASAAADDAREVDAGFVKYANFTPASFRSTNRVYRMNNRDENVSVAESFRELSYQDEPDPRVPVLNTGRVSSNNETVMWLQDKYPSEASAIPIARWAEAQLIIAEAEGGETAVDIINQLHADAGLPGFSGGTEEEIREHLIQERQREFFLESHFLGDRNRYGLPLVPASGTPYLQGGQYGDQRCFPLPDVERLNNPNVG